MSEIKDRACLICALLLPLLVFALLSAFGGPVWDCDYFEYIGWNMASGRTLYGDIWDCKGPLLYGLYAFGQWLFPGWLFAGRFVMLFLWELSIWLLYRLLRNVMGVARPGLGVLVFAVLAMGLCLFFHMGNQEIIGVALALAGMSVLALNCRDWKYFLFGIFVGLAFMTKATFVAFAAAVALSWMREVCQGGGTKEFLRRSGLSFAGFSVACLLIVLLLCPTTIWDMIDASFLYNIFERNNDHPESWFCVWRNRVVDVTEGRWAWLANYGWFLPMVAWLLWLCAWLKPNCRGRPLEGFFLKIWCGLEIALNLSGKSVYDHYCIVLCIPVTMILISSNWQRLGAWMRWLTVVACTLGELLVAEKSIHLYSGFLLRGPQAMRALRDSGLRDRVRPRETVAVCGSSSVPRILLELEVFSRNRYCGWTFWISRCAEERRHSILDEFIQACEEPENGWLFSEMDIPSLIDKYGAEERRLRTVLSGYEHVYTVDEPRVYIYRRIRTNSVLQ